MGVWENSRHRLTQESSAWCPRVLLCPPALFLVLPATYFVLALPILCQNSRGAPRLKRTGDPCTNGPQERSVGPWWGHGELAFIMKVTEHSSSLCCSNKKLVWCYEWPGKASESKMRGIQTFTYSFVMYPPVVCFVLFWAIYHTV